MQLRVSYDDDILNSGETLNFTPVLKSGNKIKALSSVVVNGKERGKYEDRSPAFDHRLRQNIPVVTADKRHGHATSCMIPPFPTATGWLVQPSM